MKKAVITGFIKYEAELNKQVLLTALSQFKQENNQSQLDAQVKIIYSGVESVPFARKIKNVMEVRLNIMELDEGLFYRVPNQVSFRPFKDLPLNHIAKVEAWCVESNPKTKNLTLEEKRERRYKELNRLRRSDFCSANEMKDIYFNQGDLQTVDVTQLIPDMLYEELVRNLERKEESFCFKYGYIEINANYEFDKWTIKIEIIDELHDLEHTYLMINEEIAVYKTFN